RQQLKAARAKKHTSGITNISDYKNLDDLIWSNNNIDERASDYFAKPSGRPSMYIGGFKRTQRCKKAELKKAAQNIRSITAYLAPALTSNIVLTSTSACELSIEIELVELKADVSVKIDKKMKIKLAIEKLDVILKKDNNLINKGVKVRMQAALQYLQLRYYYGQTKINASTTIASSLGWGDYKA
ncbi:15659_t:CDS:2, partial [Cetraspora pellucida]